MAREGLFLDLRSALNEARRTQQPVVRQRVRVFDHGRSREIVVRVLPVRPPGAERHCYLVLFEEPPETRIDAAEPAPGAAPTVERARRAPRRSLISRILAREHDHASADAIGARSRQDDETDELTRLRHEFEATKEYMQALSEQQDVANEELRAANEEILSSNEELQSTNEELETAKEELQSTNEELTTVNEQLQHRNIELDVVGSDLANLLASTGLPVVMVGSNLRIRRLTPAARKVLNLLPTDVGRPIGEIRPRLRLISLDPLIRSVVEERKPFEQEIRDDDGAWWLLRILPYRTHDDRIEGAVVVLIDVDALKRAQGGLRDAQDYSSAIVQTTHEPLLVLDSDLRVVSANRAFLAKFGLEQSNLQGRRIYDLDGGRWDIPALRDLLGRVVADPRDVEDFEMEHDFEGLGRRSLLLNARLIDQGDTPPLLLLAIEDVTQRKQRLESLTAEVKARDEFLAMLSHELRNPLSAVDNATRVLRRSIMDTPQARHAVEALDRQLGHLRRLVDDLLEISRLEHGKIVLRTEPLDLRRAVEQAVESASPLAKSRELELVSELPREPIWVEADPVRLDQVLQNLVANAIKFTATAGRIQVSATAEIRGGGAQAVLRVRDDGAGIPKEELGRVFEAFFQGDHAASDNRFGLGLGLLLVRRLVELHGGSVEASSEGVQRGTEIVVQLPLTTAPAARAAATETRSATGGSKGKRRILLVEDNADAASTMETLLRMMGHDVRTAPDGPTALTMFDDGAVDIAIVDLGLPGMSGCEVARAIRGMHDARGVTLIAHTGWAQDGDREQARQAGFDHYLVKPVDWAELERLLDGA